MDADRHSRLHGRDDHALPDSGPEGCWPNLAPGDEITADVVVTPDGKYHLENIVVTKKAGGGDAKPSSRKPASAAARRKVPDFALVNQDGKTIHIGFVQRRT